MKILKTRSSTPPASTEEKNQSGSNRITAIREATQTAFEGAIAYLRTITNQTIENCTTALKNSDGDIFAAQKALEELNSLIIQTTGRF